MEWTVPFIVYRIGLEGKLEEVFWAKDLKQAKYWLTYIAQEGDVLCKTPVHPKHSKKAPIPEYWSHKEVHGQPCTNEEEWRRIASSRNCQVDFPSEQLKQQE
jgi:hypothetical protein